MNKLSSEEITCSQGEQSRRILYYQLPDSSLTSLLKSQYVKFYLNTESRGRGLCARSSPFKSNFNFWKEKKILSDRTAIQEPGEKQSNHKIAGVISILLLCQHSAQYFTVGLTTTPKGIACFDSPSTQKDIKAQRRNIPIGLQ